MLATHFPKSVVTEEIATTAAGRRAKYCDWRVSARVITYRRVKWEIDYFAPYKRSGMDGIFPAPLQEGRSIVPYLVRIFHACQATGYIPAIWRQVKVVFIPKPGKSSYSGPGDSRPLIPTSFKTLQRLVDRFLMDDALALLSLHPDQHAYQAGKSVETARNSGWKGA